MWIPQGGIAILMAIIGTLGWGESSAAIFVRNYRVIHGGKSLHLAALFACLFTGSPLPFNSTASFFCLIRVLPSPPFFSLPSFPLYPAPRISRGPRDTDTFTTLRTQIYLSTPLTTHTLISQHDRTLGQYVDLIGQNR